MQFILLSRITVMALIFASRLVVASAVPDDVFDRQDKGELECKH